MAAKSIIEIEVKDGEYNKFIEKHKEYQSSLGEMPAAWAKVGKAIHGAAEKFILPPMTAKQAAEIGRKLTESEQQALKAAKERAKSWKEMERSSTHFAKNVAGATVSMLKWVGITSAISGLLGAGGIFGLDRLAGSVSSSRRSSQGVGVTSGEQKAFGLNFGRYVDADTNLSNIADAKSDFTKRWAFGAMGIGEGDIQHKDPAQLAVQMALQAKRVFDRGDQSQQYAQAHGLLQFYEMGELRRLHAASTEDLEASSASYGQDAKSLNQSDETQKKFQDFSIQLERAGEKIKNVFVDSITPLVPELSKLSEAFSGAVDAFLSNPDVKQWIAGFADDLKDLGSYLGSPSFKKDVTDFTTAVAQLAHKTVRALRILHLIPDESASSDPEPGATDPSDKSGAPASNKTGSSKPFFGHLATSTKNPLDTPFMRKYLGYDSNHDFSDLEGKYSLPKGLMDNVWNVESNRSKNSGTSTAGARGPFQLMPATATAYGVTDRMDFQQSSDAAAHLMQDLLKKYNGDVEKAAAAYNWGIGNSKKPRLDADIAKYGDNWKDHLPDETRKYIQKTTGNLNLQTGAPVIIEVRNNTGGSAIVTMNQVAH